MARELTLVDDFDGSAGAVERRYRIGETEYAIDLTDENWSIFLMSIEPFRTRSRVARKTRKNLSPVLTPQDRARIREWASRQGKPLAARGRFPNSLVNEYYEAQGESVKTPEDLLRLASV